MMIPDEPQSKTDHTLWFRPGHREFYLIPDDVTPPEGDLELHTLTGARCSIDASAAEQWSVERSVAKEHLATATRERLTSMRDELRDVWKRRREEGSGASASTKRSEVSVSGDSPRGAQNAETLADLFEAAAGGLAGALRGLAKDLRRDTQHDTNSPPVAPPEGTAKSEDVE